MKEEVSDFYDAYTVTQLKTGVHLRHFTILEKLKEAGLREDSKVLEVGCGIGTLTGLISAYLKKGSLIAADISPESIETAKRQNAACRNIDYVVSDMMNFIPSGKLDFVIFPDVLEHIPKENHNRIFNNICNAIHPESKFAVHIPDPQYLDYLRENQPDQLQIIDQSLYVEDFAKAIAGTPLMVDLYERYGLFCKNPDYNWIILSVKKPLNHPVKKSKIFMKMVELYRKFNA